MEKVYHHITDVRHESSMCVCLRVCVRVCVCVSERERDGPSWGGCGALGTAV